MLVQIISELNGKDINEVMNAGKAVCTYTWTKTLNVTAEHHKSFSFSGLSKLASVPAGGAVAAPAAAGGAAAGGAAPAAGMYLLHLTWAVLCSFKVIIVKLYLLSSWVWYTSLWYSPLTFFNDFFFPAEEKKEEKKEESEESDEDMGFGLFD